MAPTKKTASATDRHISRLALENFKSFQEPQDIPFGQLTVLAGANSSGKSSLLQPLLLLKQTAAEATQTGRLKLDGPHVLFENPEDFLCKPLGRKQATSFAFTIRFNDRSGYGARYVLSAKHQLTLAESSYITPDGTTSIRRDMPRDELQKVADALGGYAPPGTIPGVVSVFGCLGIGYAKPEYWDRTAPVQYSASDVFAEYSLVFPIRGSIGRLTHLTGLRNNPARDYPVSTRTGFSSGPFEHFIAGTIAEWAESKDARIELLQKHLLDLGLTWTIKPRRRSYSRIALYVGRTPQALHAGAGDVVNIADVGLGMSQALPVVVALVAAESGSTLYVEQPEIHLHPRAQVRLASIIADTVSRGVQVIVETHSALMLLEFQRLIASATISSDIVSLVWFQRNDKGMTHVASAKPDSAGAYGNWPEDFADTLLDAERGYTRAAHKKLLSETS